MVILRAKWASVYENDKGLSITLNQKKISTSGSLYEDVVITIDNGVLTLEGFYHLETKLWSFDTNTKHWLDEIPEDEKPLPEDEYKIKEGYKSLVDKWKDIKSKYLPNYTLYSYGKEKRKLKCNNFKLNYSSDDVFENTEPLQTFTEFKTNI